MQFSLRFFLAFALLAALAITSVALNRQRIELETREAAVVSENQLMADRLGDAEEAEARLLCFIGAAERQMADVETAQPKYRQLAAQQSVLEVSDPTRIARVLVPDTTWDRDDLQSLGWRIFIPASPDGADSPGHNLAIDFLGNNGELESYSPADTKRIMESSRLFDGEQAWRHPLPPGESMIVIEIESFHWGRQFHIRLNDQVVKKLTMRVVANGVSTTQYGQRQQDYAADQAVSIARWTPMLEQGRDTESLWLRILPITPERSTNSEATNDSPSVDEVQQ